MISRPVTIRCRFQHPIDITAQKVEELPSHHRDFAGINAVGAEDGAAAALGTLEEVIEPLFQDFFSEFTGPCMLAQDFSGDGEIPAVDGPQKLGPENGHVFRISGPDKKMTFIRAGAASHADVEKELKRAVALQAVFH